MKKQLEYKCDLCGHTEETNNKTTTIRVIKGAIISILSVLGLALVFLMIISSPFTVLDAFGGIILTEYSNDYDKQELRHMAIGWTSECQQPGYRSSSFCYGFQVFMELKDTPYIPNSKYEFAGKPLETLEYGSDCKGSSILYTTTMKSLGFDARVICNYEKEHCVSVLPYIVNGEDLGMYAVIDLTYPEFFIMQNGDNAWDYLEIGRKMYEENYGVKE